MNTMDIYSEIGSKVIFAFPENGLQGDIDIAKKYLVLNNEYTIEEINVGSWSTDVCLKEIPGVSFNSCLFTNYEEDNFIDFILY